MAPVLSNSKFQSLRSVSEFKRWFSRPYLGYGYSIYDQAYNISFHQKYESIEYNDINNRSCWRLLYHELGFEFLESGRYNWNLCCLCKVSILSHLDRFIWQCSYSQKRLHCKKWWEVTTYQSKTNISKLRFSIWLW